MVPSPRLAGRGGGSGQVMFFAESLAERIYGGQERLTRDEIQRRAVIAELPDETIAALSRLADREYGYHEFTAMVGELGLTRPV